MKYVEIEAIEECGVEDVYCLSVPETGNFVANGIVIKNCDALRYVCMTHYGQRNDLIEKTQAERFAESERRKWNQNPMNYPGYAPGDYGYQSIPMRK